MKLKISTTQIITCSLVFLFFLLPSLSNAQPGFGDDVNDVPIDGGLSLLAVAGIGYGAKKIQQRKAMKKI